MERRDPVAVSAAAMGRLPRGPAVSAAVSPSGSAAEAPGEDGHADPLGRRRATKTARPGPDDQVDLGRSMRSGSSSAARPVDVGCAGDQGPRSVAPSTGRASAILAPFASGTGSSCIAVESSGSMPNVLHVSEKAPAALQPCRTSGRALRFRRWPYHHARPAPKMAGRSRKRFALEFMPPYSPELNPLNDLETDSEEGDA